MVWLAGDTCRSDWPAHLTTRNMEDGSSLPDHQTCDETNMQCLEWIAGSVHWVTRRTMAKHKHNFCTSFSRCETSACRPITSAAREGGESVLGA